MIEEIANFLVSLLDQVGYLGVFIATVIESFFAPIPSEIVLFTAGYYAKSAGGIPVLVGLCLVGALGNFIGTLPFYLISRYGAETVLPRFLKKWGPFLLISENDLKKAEKLFAKRGNVIVFFARMIPAVRSLIAFPAGISKMNFTKYTAFTLLGSTLWNLLLAGIGYFAYDFREKVFAILRPIEVLVLIVLIILAILYIGRVFYQVRKLRTGG